MISIEHWHEIWEELGVEANNDELFYEVLSSYREPHRKYHTTKHLSECFAQLSKIRTQAVRPTEIEIALWFHDAIYETKRHDNEKRSAEWAQWSISHAGLPDSVGQRVYDLVMATKHNVVPTDKDAKIIVDIDLAILGSSPERFDEYESQIREEYAWVPEVEFRHKRLSILNAIATRPWIYNTE